MAGVRQKFQIQATAESSCEATHKRQAIRLPMARMSVRDLRFGQLYQTQETSPPKELQILTHIEGFKFYMITRHHSVDDVVHFSRVDHHCHSLVKTRMNKIILSVSEMCFTRFNMVIFLFDLSIWIIIIYKMVNSFQMTVTEIF